MNTDAMALWAAEETDLATLQSMRVAMRTLHERRIREREAAQSAAVAARAAADRARSAAEHALAAEAHVRARLVVLDQRVRVRRDAIDPPMVPDVDLGAPTQARGPSAQELDAEALQTIRPLRPRVHPVDAPGANAAPAPGDPGYDAFLAQQDSDRAAADGAAS